MMTKFHDVHYNYVIMGTMSSQITRLTIVYSSVYSGTYQRKHQSSASLAFVRGIHGWLVNSPHKGPVTQKMFTFDDVIMLYAIINTLRPRQNGRHFADDIFKCNFLDKNVWIPITISLKFIPQGPINNIPALAQIMAWHRPGGKPLSELRMISLPRHSWVTRMNQRRYVIIICSLVFPDKLWWKYFIHGCEITPVIW